MPEKIKPKIESSEENIQIEKEPRVEEQEKPTFEKKEPMVEKKENLEEIQGSEEKSHDDLKNLDQKNQVERLIKIAQEKDIGEAIKIAEDLNDPFVLDGLHDSLTSNEKYQQMVQEGKIKKL